MKGYLEARAAKEARKETKKAAANGNGSSSSSSSGGGQVIRVMLSCIKICNLKCVCCL